MAETHPDDEFHPPTSDDPYWTETCWFTFTVPERRLSGQLYPFFRGEGRPLVEKRGVENGQAPRLGLVRKGLELPGFRHRSQAWDHSSSPPLMRGIILSCWQCYC